MKKIIYILLKSVSAIIFAFLIIQCLSYILIDDSSSYTRLTFHEFYTQQENIDTLYVGSSHCFRAINPQIMDEKTGKNNFNAGTSCQYLDGSYAIIQEAVKNNELERVYVEMYYGQIGLAPENRENVTATYIISDYLKFSVNKVMYLLQATDAAGYANSFLPLRRDINKIFDYDYIFNTIQKKSTEEYKKYCYISNEDEFYSGKGFVFSDYGVPKHSYGDLDGFAPINAMSEYDIKIMNKIIDCCKKNDIEVIFFCAPMSDFRLVSLGNYDDYVQEIRAFCDKNDVKYWDFNLCKREYMDLDESYFIDDNHLNGKGAEIFSLLLADLDIGVLDPKEVFHNTYLDKVSEDNNIVYGTILYQNSDGFDIKTVKKNYSGQLYYSVYQQEGEESIMLQEHTENTFVPIMGRQHGSIQIITTNEKGIELNNTLISY